MTYRFVPIIDKLLFALYLALAVITPLIFTTRTTELFEVPKMFFVYAVSLMVLFLTVAKFVAGRKILIPKNIILIAFAAFVTVQVLSTFFSIDVYTSVFGFPSRLNGGLLSQFAYLIIFAAALINLSKDGAKKILITTVATALFVSLWGIPAHFGKDPSCLVLTGRLTSNCWQADFNPRLRIFSTLGQPNWLASYLTLIIPIALGFALASKNQKSRLLFLTCSIVLLLAILFTNSRSGLAGVTISLAIFGLLQIKKIITKNLKYSLPIFAVLSIVALIFGTTLTQKTLTRLHTLEGKNQSTQPATPTDSAQIRLIVWQGAWQIFKKWPVLGSGPETFVSSYFMLRPAIHNQTSEWEFYYNKAHNEFLNYLANTGTLGFLAYLAFILATVITLYKLRAAPRHPRPSVIPANAGIGVNSSEDQTFVPRTQSRGILDQVENDNGKFSTSSNNMIIKASIASFAGYLVTLFFGFSTVATQTTFFLLLAAVMVSTEEPSNYYRLTLSKKHYQFPLLILSTVLGIFLLSYIARLSLSDIFEKRAQDLESADPNKALTAYRNALKAAPVKNPYLTSNYANTQATYLTNLNPADAQNLTKKTDNLAQSAYSLSPSNYLIVQKVAKTYLLISSYSKDYQDKAERYGNRLITLAPTYPDAWSTLAKIQIVLDQNNEAKESIQKALLLKPDYLEAKELLDELNSKSYNNY